MVAPRVRNTSRINPEARCVHHCNVAEIVCELFSALPAVVIVRAGGEADADADGDRRRGGFDIDHARSRLDPAAIDVDRSASRLHESDDAFADALIAQINHVFAPELKDAARGVDLVDDNLVADAALRELQDVVERHLIASLSRGDATFLTVFLVADESAQDGAAAGADGGADTRMSGGRADGRAREPADDAAAH